MQKRQATSLKNYGACPAPTTFASYSHFFLMRHLTPTTLLPREPNNTPSDIALTDAATARDRKRLFQQMSKPFSSPVATALRHTDGSLATTPSGIENEFTAYLQTLAEPPPEHFKIAHDADFTDTPTNP